MSEPVSISDGEVNLEGSVAFRVDVDHSQPVQSLVSTTLHVAHSDSGGKIDLYILL